MKTDKADSKQPTADAGSSLAATTKMSRRALIASLGIAGGALVSGSIVSRMVASGDSSVMQSVYGGSGTYMDVKDFGAVGDGLTDDTQAIQDALDSSAKHLILDGHFLITGQLVLTTAKTLLGGGTLTLSAANGNIPMLLINAPGATVILHNLTFNLNENSGAGIRATEYAHITFNHCTVENVKPTELGQSSITNAYGIYFTSTSGKSVVDNCIIRNIYGNTFTNNIATGVYTIRNTTLINSRIQNIFPSEDADGFKIHTSDVPSRCIVQHNHFENCEKRAAKLQAPGNIFSDNIVSIRETLDQTEVNRRTQRYGIASQHNNNKIHDNLFISPYFHTVIQLDTDNIEGNSIVNNTVHLLDRDVAYTNSMWGIRVLPRSGPSVARDLIISGNVIQVENSEGADSNRHLAYGIAINTSSNRITITNNIIHAARVGAVSFADSTEHRFLKISGNTAFTTFRLLHSTASKTFVATSITNNTVVRTWQTAAPDLQDGSATFTLEDHNILLNSRSV